MEKSKENIFGKLVLDVMDNAVNSARTGRGNNGISSGFKMLDKYIGGFRKGNLCVIASCPRAGKMSYALTMAMNIAFGEKPVPVGFFSFLMRGSSVVEHMIANRARINLLAMRNGKIGGEEYDRMMKAAEYLYEYSGYFIINDTPGLSLDEFSFQIRNMVRENCVKIVFIDGISMVGQENHSISQFDRSIDVCRTLKLLADELGIPIICICPVRTSKNQARPPVLADLREFGLLDEFADQVIFLDDDSWSFDPSDYSEKEEEKDMPINLRRIRVIVAKNRDGNAGIFHANMDTSCLRFEEVEPIRF